MKINKESVKKFFKDLDWYFSPTSEDIFNGMIQLTARDEDGNEVSSVKFREKYWVAGRLGVMEKAIELLFIESRRAKGKVKIEVSNLDE